MRNVLMNENCGFLITDKLTRKYFTDIDVAEGYLLLAKEHVYFTDARYFSAAKVKIEKAGIKPILFEGLSSVEAEIKRQGLTKLFIDFDKETVSDFNEYKTMGVEILDGSLALKKRRAVKSEDELENIKKACEIAQSAYYKAIREVKEGMTERELADKISGYMLEAGAEGNSFDLIVAFGAHASVPHHETSDTRLIQDTEILVDMGCVVNGYCSDLTRTCFFGKPSRKFADAYYKVLKANEKAIEKIEAGVSGIDADKFARDVLADAKLDKYFTHSLGHGVGLEIHEYPALSPKKEDILLNGMVFTIEPGVYVDGEYGIRIEDTVVLKDGKVQRLFTDSKELMTL